MNRPIAIAIVAGCLIGIYAAGTTHTYRITQEMQNKLTATEQIALSGKSDKAKESAEEMQRFWEEEEKRLMLYIRHNDIDLVAKNLSELTQLIQFGDTAEFCAKLNETQVLVKHIWESDLPLPKNIL